MLDSVIISYRCISVPPTRFQVSIAELGMQVRNNDDLILCGYKYKIDDEISLFLPPVPA
jgi:hypothetical protein